MAVLPYAEKLIEAFDFEQEKWFVLTEKPGKDISFFYSESRLSSKYLVERRNLSPVFLIKCNYRGRVYLLLYVG